MNKTKTFIVSGFLLAAMSLPAAAQTKDGGISADMLESIKKEQAVTAVNPALSNALAGNSIDVLAKNYANNGKVYLLQRGDPLAEHHRPEAERPLLDVQRLQRAPLELRAAH